jgi:hypothetical protein
MYERVLAFSASIDRAASPAKAAELAMEYRRSKRDSCRCRGGQLAASGRSIAAARDWQYVQCERKSSWKTG